MRKRETFLRVLCSTSGAFDEIKKIVPPEEMEVAVFSDDKQTREENISEITDKLKEAFADKEEWLAVLGEAVYQYEKKTVRKMILKDHKRPDGRAIDQIRPLAAEVDMIPRVHGSAMFTRGQTQICTVTTLAPLSEAQRLDGLDEAETSKRYMHHYNFPSYSVGETKPSRGPGDDVRSVTEHWLREHWYRYFLQRKNSHMQSVPYPRHLSPTVLLPRQVSVHPPCL